MRFLCVSDIQGEADAFHAVLATAERRGFSRILVAGDLCFPGPQPLATWRLLMATKATCTKGLGDHALVSLDAARVPTTSDYEKERIARLLQTRTELGEIILARIGQLPTTVRIPLPNGAELLLVHGSPRDASEGIGAELDDDEIMALVGDDPADVVVCGSTHVPFDRTVSDVRIVNVGSVGEAPGGGFAHATFIEAGPLGIEVEQITVPWERKNT